MMSSRLFRKIVRVTWLPVLTLAAGTGALLAAMWLDHTRGTSLPMPTGRYAVGRTSFDWVDRQRMDAMALNPGSGREVFAWVWYPASPSSSNKQAAYLPNDWRIAIEHQRGVLANKFLTRDLSLVRTHSFDEANISPREASYPVVLMQAPFASALAEDLASHGYVVVGLYAPYRSGMVVFPDGRAIAALARNKLSDHGPPQIELAEKLIAAGSADMSMALDKLDELDASDPSGRFRERLNMREAGVFGWSIGGATALQFCHDDRRCRAAIDIDGYPLGSVVKDGLDRPTLFVMEDMSQCEGDAECLRIEANIRSIDSLGPALWISIRGANHFLFSDDGALLKSPLLVSGLHLLRIVPIGGRRQIAITAHCVDTFFDEHLKGMAVADARGQGDYPEVVTMR